jgi:hypothetical protein
VPCFVEGFFDIQEHSRRQYIVEIDGDVIRQPHALK